MGLFSRRKKSDDPQPEEPAIPDAVASAPEEPAEAVPSVGISTTTFRGVASAATASPDRTVQAATNHRGPAEAPAPSETIPGLRDNVLLADALARLSAPPTPRELIDVARQLLQGNVFLRVKGDARSLLSEGKDLPLAVAAHEGKQFVLVYSSGAAIQASVRSDGDTATSAMGQPVLAVLRHVLAGTYEGVILDHASGQARAVLPRAILQKALDDADGQLSVKTLLAAPRTAETAAAVAAALVAAPLWIAVSRREEGGPVGIAESRTADGKRYLELFTHPLEVHALGRGDQAMPLDAARLGKALGADAGLTGIIVDPAGPWVRLERSDLPDILALAE